MKKEYLVHLNLWEQQVNDLGNNRAGIYKLRCFANNAIDYRTISRLLATDTNGVLYIGSSNDLTTRILALRTALCSAANYDGFANVGKHPCGIKYSPSLQVALPFKNLCVAVYPVLSEYKADAEAIEVSELRQYEAIFGELPPLNDGYPKARWREHDDIDFAFN